ncbi:caspase-3-like [Lingula anatina]|uniref:Caspase-3-like n=1 Tax=Lingula anatina TaxID=7574 RepID=A0A1S3K1E8_LINAN|nr:caspase-3-like [Lingula anatina]|eukprot:XP_013416458.1 caspase-3-like [Lingula anatina]
MRGKQAIHVFYDALVETEQGHLADLLFPERKEERLAKEAARAPPTSTPCPANTQPVNTQPRVTKPMQPEEEDVQLPELPCDAGHSLVFVDSLKFDLSDSVLRLQEKYSQVYKNVNANKGRALIILNIKMEGHDILRTNLTRLLKKLGYKVDHKKNLKAEKIKEVLRTEAQNVEHGDAESFICIFIGYGKGGILTGKDGKTICLSEVTCFFNGQNCASLVNKPKLFFAQTCVDYETNKTEGETREVMEQLTADLQAASLRDGGEGKVATDAVPTMADIFVAASTEYTSSTETSPNFWFLEALVYVFCTFAHSDSLNSMLTKINRILSRKSAQLDYQSSSLRKEFYFFPKRPVTSDSDSCQQNDAVESATGGRSLLAQASCGDDTAQLVLG